MEKTYTTPALTEIGRMNEVVHTDQVSLTSDGTTVPGDMVLITLTKS